MNNESLIRKDAIGGESITSKQLNECLVSIGNKPDMRRQPFEKYRCKCGRLKGISNLIHKCNACNTNPYAQYKHPHVLRMVVNVDTTHSLEDDEIILPTDVAEILGLTTGDYIVLGHLMRHRLFKIEYLCTDLSASINFDANKHFRTDDDTNNMYITTSIYSSDTDKLRRTMMSLNGEI